MTQPVAQLVTQLVAQPVAQPVTQPRRGPGLFTSTGGTRPRPAPDGQREAGGGPAGGGGVLAVEERPRPGVGGGVTQILTLAGHSGAGHGLVSAVVSVVVSTTKIVFAQLCKRPASLAGLGQGATLTTWTSTTRTVNGVARVSVRVPESPRAGASHSTVQVEVALPL